MTTELPGHIVDQAVDWAVKLGSGAAGNPDRTAHADWLQADPRNAEAWQRLTHIDREFEKIPQAFTGLAARTLEDAPDLRRKQQKQRERRQLIGLMGIGFIGLGFGYFSWERFVRVPEPAVVHSTPRGRQLDLSLSDDSRVRLNTSSSIQVAYSRETRNILLNRGEIYVTTGKDGSASTDPRPFWVNTAHARVQAVGTRFNVRQTGDRIRVHVVDGEVRVYPRQGKGHCSARAGQTVIAGADNCKRLSVDTPVMDPVAWVDGVLVAKNMSLDIFAAELSRYHSGEITCTPPAARLKISGVFQLRGSNAADRALSVLVRTLPVSLDTEGRQITIREK